VESFRKFRQACLTTLLLKFKSDNYKTQDLHHLKVYIKL